MILITCSNYAFIIKIIAYLIKLIQWAVPITLIFMASLDLFKAMTNPDDKNRKDLGNKIFKRLIYAILVFLVPVIIRIIFRAVGRAAPAGYGDENSPTSWMECINQYL